MVAEHTGVREGGVGLSPTLLRPSEYRKRQLWTTHGGPPGATPTRARRGWGGGKIKSSLSSRLRDDQDSVYVPVLDPRPTFTSWRLGGGLDGSVVDVKVN